MIRCGRFMPTNLVHWDLWWSQQCPWLWWIGRGACPWDSSPGWFVRQPWQWKLCWWRSSAYHQQRHPSSLHAYTFSGALRGLLGGIKDHHVRLLHASITSRRRSWRRAQRLTWGHGVLVGSEAERKDGLHLIVVGNDASAAPPLLWIDDPLLFSKHTCL
jgi:hypothetical protein